MRKNKSLFFVAGYLFLSLVFCSKTEIKLPERGICAHRGANSTYPENSIAAFQEAIRLGAQMIEFDVC
ncbi:MAG TPA: glycerophosphodiester phosphodiesterase [Bacteroidetes bacterium]|nr:glycerophosphodiester phosphodiesterase [Bacteroidota bacterium]